MNWNKLILHATYVAGITFFSVLGSSYGDGILVGAEVYNALMTSFIAAGSGFFIGFGVESGQTTYKPKKIIEKHKINVNAIRCSMHNIMFLR